jgi:hypothetical protein
MMKNQKQKLWLSTALTALIATTTVLIQDVTKNQMLVTASQSGEMIAQGSQSILPKQLPVGGWLAVATRPNKQGRFKYPWSPVNAKAQVAIFTDENNNWKQVKPGTSLLGITPGLSQEIKFKRSDKEPYGCDDIPTQMATFTAARPFPEGPIWLLPPGSNPTATALRLEQLKLDKIPTNILPANRRKASDARAWKAGSSTILLQKQSSLKVKLTVLVNSQVVFTANEEKYFFTGAAKTPVNLSTDGEPGISQPVGAFQLSANQPPVIVLWEPGYEGHGFSILASVKGKMQRINQGSVYFCAF